MEVKFMAEMKEKGRNKRVDPGVVFPLLPIGVVYCGVIWPESENLSHCAQKPAVSVCKQVFCGNEKVVLVSKKVAPIWFLGGLWASQSEHHLVPLYTVYNLRLICPKLDKSHQNYPDWWIALQERGKICIFNFRANCPCHGNVRHQQVTTLDWC